MNDNNEIKEATWYELNEYEQRKYIEFIRTSLEKNATFRGAFKNVRRALDNRSVAIKLYIPELGMKVRCKGNELLEFMSDLESEMPLANDANNYRTNISVGTPFGFRVTPDPRTMIREANSWFLELTERSFARWIAKAFSTDDVVAIGLEVESDSSIKVHVAYKYEAEEESGFDYVPITASFLSHMMGCAA